MKRFLVSALLLTLAACGTPADLAAPTLEAQFGTPDKGFGADVAAPAGRVYVLSEQEGGVPGSDAEFENAHLHLYTGSGTLAWTRRLALPPEGDHP